MVSGPAAVSRLKDLIDEMASLTRAVTAEAREATYSTMRAVHYPVTAFDEDGWLSPDERLAHWPKRWVPAEQMCPATVEGVGSGEGSPNRPGVMACTRLAGHRDVRSGNTRGHTWGPERYSEERARSAANRVATEEWAQFQALLEAVDA